MEDVVIIGAGPTGLLLGIDLIRHGIHPIIVDKRCDPDISDTKWSKAIGIHARTLEIFDCMDIEKEFLEQSITIAGAHTINEKGETISKINIFNHYESKFKILASLPQYKTESLLRTIFKEKGGEIKWDKKVTGLKETLDECITTFEDNSEMKPKWIVGCDGGHSIVRRCMDIPFVGEDIPLDIAMVSCRFDSTLDPKEAVIAVGKNFILLLPEPDNRMRIMIPVSEEKVKELGKEPSLEFFQGVCDESLSQYNCKLSNPEWLTIFRVHERLAGNYRKGRILLGGDAAHTHSPAGGQGMNTGFQDSFNLSWKLALIIKGVGNTNLLDSYEEERRPIAAALLKNSGTTTNAVFKNYPFSNTLKKIVFSALPHLKIFHHRAAQGIGMLDISYSQSSIVKDYSKSVWNWIGMKGDNIVGSRVPHGMIKSVDGDSSFIMDICYSTNHSLFIFCSSSNETLMKDTLEKLARYRKYINIYLIKSDQDDVNLSFDKIFIDEDHQISNLFGMQDEGFILVRPDQHVSFKSAANLENLENYLKIIFI